MDEEEEGEVGVVIATGDENDGQEMSKIGCI